MSKRDDDEPMVEELARFLFLEDAIADRRVLVVGHRSLALGPALLELGARRVVMAIDDQALVEQSRALPPVHGIDHRLVRDGVLPGDDGAFDLVVDFSLPFALALGQEWKKSEIRRLLSRDGFALTALPNDALAGLPGFYPRREALPRRTYRELAQELIESFDVVEVYFQSLLLGFFFGSFEVEPGDDGVAPHTGLMGEEAEPASYYVFAFGNAVPVIADVSLVQMPLARLLQSSPHLFAPPAFALPPSTENAQDPVLADAPRESPPEHALASARVLVDESQVTGLLDEIAALKSEIMVRDDVLHELSTRVPLLRDQVAVLVEEIATRTVERDGMARLAEDLEVALVARDQHLDLAERELSERRARMQQLETELRRAVDVVKERTTWVEAGQGAIEQMEQDLGGMTAERNALVHRVEELELIVANVRAELDARGRRANALALELDEARSALGNAARLLDDARTASRRAAELPALEARLAVVEDERAALAEELAEREAASGALVVERDRLARACDEQREERVRLADGVNALVEARTTLQARVDALMAERASVDESVAALRGESESQRGRVVALESERENLITLLEERSGATERAAHLELEKAALTTELQSVRERLRAAQASVEERSRELGQARDVFQEIAGQRDTLNQVVVARDRELGALKTELGARANEIDRLTAEVVEMRKSSADLTRLVEELRGGATAEHQRVVELRQKLDDESRARAQAERDLEEALSFARGLEESERAATALLTERDEALRERDAALTTLRADLAAREDTQRATLSAREEELGVLGAALRAREQTIAELEQAARALDDQLQAERVTANAHEARARALASAETALERELTTERERVASLTTAQETLEHELAASRARLVAVEDETAQRAEKLQAREQAAREELAANARYAEEEQARLKGLIDHAASHARELEEQVAEKADEIARATLALGEANAALAASTDEKNALSQALAETEARVDQIRAALDDERADHAATRVNLAEATRALDDVSLSAEAVLAEKGALEASRRELQEGQGALREELTAAMALLDDESRAKEVLVREHAAALENAEAARAQAQTREDLLTSLLDEAQHSASRAESERALQSEVLHEAQAELVKERARGDVLADDLGEAQDLLREKDASVVLLRSELEELQGDTGRISREQIASREALAAAEENLLAEWTRGEALRTQVRALEAALHDSNARAALHQAQLEEAQTALTEESARASLMGAELDDARATFDRVRADMRAEEERFTTGREALEGERASLTAELRSVRELLMTSEAALATATSERASLAEQQGLLDDEKRASERSLEQAESRADAWESRALDAENRIESASLDADAARERAVTAQRALEESEAARSVLADEIRAMRESLERAEEERRRADDLARVLEVERSERRSLEEKLGALSSDSDDALRLRERISVLDGEQRTLQGHYDAARERVRALEDDMWRAEESLHEEREAKGRAELALQESTSERERLEDALKSLQDDPRLSTSTLPASVSDDDDDGATLREELRAERAQTRRLEEEVAGLADGYRDAEAARGLLERDLAALRTRTSELESALAIATESVTSMKSASDGSRVRELEELVVRLRTDLDEKNDRINRLTQRLVSVEGL